MKIVTPVAIIPESGETVWQVSMRIAEAIETGKIGAEMLCLKLPIDANYPEESGKTIEISGTTVNQIRDSIAKQTVRGSF